MSLKSDIKNLHMFNINVLLMEYSALGVLRW